MSKPSPQIDQIIDICDKNQVKCSKLKQNLSIGRDTTTDEYREVSTLLIQLSYDFKSIISLIDMVKLNENSLIRKLENCQLRKQEVESILMNREKDVSTLEAMLNDSEKRISELTRLNNQNQNYHGKNQRNGIKKHHLNRM